MQPYLEKVAMPDNTLPIRVFVTTASDTMLQVHPHWHKEIEILHFLEGTARQQVGKYLFPVSDGEIAIVASDCLHSTYSMGVNAWKIAVYQFSPEAFIMPGVSKDERKLVEDFNKLIFHGPIQVNSKLGQKLLQCLEEIYHEFTVKEQAYEFVIKSGIFKLLAILLRHSDHAVRNSPDESSSPKTREMLQNTFNLIDEQFSGDISLSAAAKASNLSVTHFSRIFKQSTGMSFKQYLILYRLNRAEALLNSSQSLTEIALECGFGSVDSFIRSFKKYKNATPSMFRRS